MTQHLRVILRDAAFFVISNTFMSNARLKLAKNQAHAKQHLQAEHLMFGNYLDSSSTLSSKSNRTYTKRLTLSDPEKFKNAIFEIPIIPQTLNINN